MPRPQKGINRATRQLIRVQKQIKLSPKEEAKLVGYLIEQIDINIKRRDLFKARVDKWRLILSGQRAKPTTGRRRTASNLSVPMMIWARVAVRARLTESLMENKPFISMEPGGGFSTNTQETGLSPQSLVDSFAKFLAADILSPQGLGGRAVIESIAAESVDNGGAALKVVQEVDTVKMVKDPDSKAVPRRVVVPGRVKWGFISVLDLLYQDGFGTNTQEMPYIGHMFPRTWSEISSWGELGHYNSAQLDKVKDYYVNDSTSSTPCEARTHKIAEIYMDWDTDGDGVQEAILIDWHIEAKTWLRVVWNPYPDGYRPILANQFDIPPKVTDLRGQGVSEKLEGPQDEADAVHNIAIEAGKRGAAHAIVIKTNTRAEEDFGGEEDVLPGDIIITDNPKEDVVAVALGNPAAGAAGIELEEHSRMYVTRTLGMDEAKVGNVEAGKRVAASVGMATMKEGRMIIKSALTSISQMLNEAVYLTIGLYQRNIPERALVAALGQEVTAALLATVFNTQSPKTTRDSLLVHVNSQDAAVAQENKRSEMMTLSQALFPFFDRLEKYGLIMSSEEATPQYKEVIGLLVQRMERSMEALLNTMETITNPEDLLVRVNEIHKILEATPEPNPQSPVGPEAEVSPLGDLGAGVV